MEKQYALIKDNAIQNIIIADDDFIQNIAADWDLIQRVNDGTDSSTFVGIGWPYVDGAFVAPVISQVEVE